MPARDWAKVEAEAIAIYPEWLHIGDEMARTTADALRLNKMRAKNFEVRTRNTHRDSNGVRRCSIYVRKAGS